VLLERQRIATLDRPSLGSVRLPGSPGQTRGIHTIVISSPEAVDRYERGRLRGGSVRVVRSDLPTLDRDR
jgi:hypothetical protein